MTPAPSTRRSFFGLAGGAALLCTIGGREIDVSSPGGLEQADAAAAQVGRPRAATAATVPQIQPAPGGARREYWVQAETVRWAITPKRRDDWHGRRLSGRNAYTAYVYRLMTPGFAGYATAAPPIPGPTLTAEVGDVLVVHFRNAERRLNQAVTMHPHGVKYNPEYDGAYMGEYTRAGGFIAPGETFTYQWECTPESVGAWPYHDHGPNHTVNTFRGLFGAIVIRPRGAKQPDRLHTLFVHQLSPPVTRLQSNFHCINGRAYAGNTPTLTARVGEDVEIHAFGMDDNFHTFHIHGHRWRDPAGSFTDNPAMGPNECVTARFVEDNPGRWLYHCHVFSHQDAGMAGWYVVEP
ncbi:MAG TPA: multicopper oxidase domain-containing protein [Solirubrobacteraceae bacterium]|nr:multicopper oxidase domain-containing protein [Solirubrobacteraceae bacterium]